MSPNLAPIVAATLLCVPAWAQTVEDEKLMVGDNLVQDFFGKRIGVTEEWLIITEPNDNLDYRPSWGPGTAYFYHREPSGWRLAQQVTPDDSVISSDFGRGLDIDGQVAVIGQPSSHIGAHKRGAAYVYEYRQDRWRQTARLAPDGLDIGDQFGWSVAVDGERILVGARGDDDIVFGSGAGYIFERVNGQWTKMAKLLPYYPPDPPAGVGWSCALSGDTAVVVSGNGPVAIFELLRGEWRQTTLLWDPTGYFSDYGWSVDLDGDTLVVGAPMLPGIGVPGAIAVYERTAPGQWQLHTLRNAPNPDINGGIGTDRFGEDVAIHGDHILVGATMAPDLEGEYVGEAYLFERRPNKWKFIERFTTSDSDEAINALGNAVALSSSFVVVADEVAVAKTPGVRSGVVYSYDRALGTIVCDAQPNSAGLAATLELTGSLVAEVGDLTLSAASLPRHELGFFLASRSEGFIPNPGGSDGDLCLGTPYARLTASAGSSGAQGTLEYQLTPLSILFDKPDTIQAGESWTFQTWYRDQASPGGSNFSTAVTVVFR
jgi:FG-GAP repeat